MASGSRSLTTTLPDFAADATATGGTPFEVPIFDAFDADDDGVDDYLAPSHDGDGILPRMPAIRMTADGHR